MLSVGNRCSVKCLGDRDRRRRKASTALIAAAAICAATGSAMGTPREQAAFSGVDSQGWVLVNTSTTSSPYYSLNGNPVQQTASFSGGYPVRSLRVSGTLSNTGAATNNRPLEARVLVLPPSGNRFVVQPVRSATWTSGAVTFSNVVIPISEEIPNAAGLWTFIFFEGAGNASQLYSGYQRSSGADSTWTSLTIVFDDETALPPGAATLAAVAGQYTAVNVVADAAGAAVGPTDAYINPNYIPAMQAGESLSCPVFGTTPAQPDAMNRFVIRPATAPVAIYEYTLILNPTGLSTPPSSTSAIARIAGVYTYGAAGSSASPAGVPGLAVYGAEYMASNNTTGLNFPAPAQAATVDGLTRANTTRWYGFGRGELVRYNVGQVLSATASTVTGTVTSTLARTTVTPTVVPLPVSADDVIIGPPGTGSVGTMWVYDSQLHPVEGWHRNATGTAGSLKWSPTLPQGSYYLAWIPNSSANGCSSGRPFGLLSPITLVTTVESNILVPTLSSAATSIIEFGGSSVQSVIAVTTAPQQAAWIQFSVTDTGACCEVNGTCTAVSRAVCTGSFQGINTVCTPNPCPAPTIGACCCGSSCSLTQASGCVGSNRAFAGAGSSCTPLSFTAPCCRADYNHSGAISVQDIFDFLTAYFQSDSCADSNDGGSITVQDIFDFLAGYFSGC